MFKRIISIALSMVLILSFSFPSVALNTEDLPLRKFDESFFANRRADEKILSTATLEDDFNDGVVVVILTTEASRNNRDYTAKDFPEINVAGIKDIVRLSDKEHRYTNALWRAEQRIDEARRATSEVGMNTKASLELNEAFDEYQKARQEVAEKTLVNPEEFRRIFFIRLAEPGKENVLEAIEKLQTREDVRYAGPNYIPDGPATDSVSTNTNNSPQSVQWALDRIDAPAAWNITTGNATVRVGIIDSGINANHPALFDNMDATSVALSKCFLGCGCDDDCDYCGECDDCDGFAPNGRPTDPFGHGTHVAGIVAANDSVSGIFGIAKNVQLVSLRVHDWFGGWGDYGTDAVAMAVNHARINNITILNASLSIGYDNSFNQATRTAVSSYSGLFVVSAGNYASNTNNNPRFYNFPNVIVVGNSDQVENRTITCTHSIRPCSFYMPCPGGPKNGCGSNFGSSSVHLFAPGKDILSTCANIPCYGSCNSTPQFPYCYKSGTSMAAPYVTGVTALIASAFPNDAYSWRVRQAIMYSVNMFDSLEDLCSTWGRLNAHNALLAMNNIPIYIEIKGVQYSTNLTFLDLSSKSLTNADIVPLKYMVNLQTLYLWNNQISDLTPLSGLTNLRALSLWKNQVNNISALAGLTNLRNLDLGSNQITNISSLVNLNMLVTLDLDFNQITDITPLVGKTTLRALVLHQNPISNFTPISTLVNLQQLGLFNVGLSDITFLSPLVNLTWLNLHNNQISDLSPLGNLNNMQVLLLPGNPINTNPSIISVVAPNLRELDVRSTGIPLSTIQILQFMMPNCLIRWP